MVNTDALIGSSITWVKRKYADVVDSAEHKVCQREQMANTKDKSELVISYSLEVSSVLA
jgi:hypothetical protein